MLRTLSIAVLAAVSLARCASIGEECLAKRDYECASLQARMALQQKPTCCRCLYIAARADEALKVPRQDKTVPAQYVAALESVAAMMNRAAACAPRNKEHLRGAMTLRQQVEEARSDADPTIWAAVQSAQAPDERIRAVLSHRQFYTDHCPHDVEAELRAYLGYLNTSSSSAIRARLPMISGTSIHAAAAAVATERRFEELQQLNDISSWEAALGEFAGTLYASRIGPELQRAIGAAVERETDPDRIEGLCRRLEADSDRNRCHDRFRYLLHERLSALVAAEEIEAFCPRFDLEEDRAECRERFRNAALGAARERPSTHANAVALRACKGAPCITEALELAVAFDSRQAYQRFVSERVPGPSAVKDSRQAWQSFLGTMNAYVGRILRGQRLEHVAPDVHAQIQRRIDNARKDSLQKTQTVSARWSTTRRSIHTWYKPTLVYRADWLKEIDGYLNNLITALQVDESNKTAQRLIRDLIAERKKLDDKTDVQIGVAKAVVDFGIDSAIGGISSRRVRLAVKIGYAVISYFAG